MNPQDIREKIGRFRILVVGRANAGKTTLLKRVCDTTENPEIFDGAGNKIDAAVVESSVDRGYHDINNEVVFKSNKNFVFHDSRGFEAGGEDEFNMMKKFVSERASTLKLKERIHAIWYCIPMDEHHRAITKAEERFFAECDTSSVPVIAVFTKLDGLWNEAYGQLRELGLTRAECKRRTPDKAMEIFAEAKTWDRLCEARYPPKGHICLAEMEKDNADCGPLLECTTSALGDEMMQMVLISTQWTNLSLCVKYAVERTLISYVRKARTSTGISWKISEDTYKAMQRDISAWFPHTKEFAEAAWDQEAEAAEAFAERAAAERAWARAAEAERAAAAWAEEADAWAEEARAARAKNELDPDNLLASMQLGQSLERASASLPSPQFRPFHILTQTLKFGIALVIILEHSFFLLQGCKQESENVFKLAAVEYRTSQAQTDVEKAVKEVLHQNDGDDTKLGCMVIDIIMRCHMSKVSLAQERT